MSKNKNIQTQNADLNLVRKFLAYANCADASYALLEPVFEGVVKDKKGKKLEEDLDTQTLGDKFNNQNSTYARAIEARFEEAMIINV
ncbi:hypothetical protein [Helicobacter sp. MIT 14-3879]|uniref:hypothetical protein n=1 Tax=Helicobacter sp. MIT 14-3879 TaxID=2040649 RepID=UPI0015F1738C|nr:hypothetical protein [Helicobacter sp. MIT 14-3879]